MIFRNITIALLLVFAGNALSQTPEELDSAMLYWTFEEPDLMKREVELNRLLYVAETKEYHLQQSYLLRFLGDCASDLTEYNKAVSLYKRGLAICNKYGYEQSRQALVHSMAGGYFYIDEMDSALFYFKKALSYTAINDTVSLARNYLNLANCYYELENLELTAIYADSVILVETMANIHQMTPIAEQLKFFIKIDKREALDENILGIKEFVKEETNPEALVMSYQNMARAFEYKGDYDSAITYYRLTANYADTINDQFYLIDANERISSLSSLLYVKNKKKEAWIWGLSAGLILLAFIAILVARTISQKRKIESQELKIKNQEVNRLLQEQEINTAQAMLAGQDQERRRIAEELHDRLGSMLATVKLHFGHVEDAFEKNQVEARDQYNKAESLLDEACREVRRISHDLYSGVLMKFGLKAALEQLKETISDSAGIQVQLFSSGLKKRLTFDAEMNLYRIVQELVANTIKYSGASKISLQLNQNGDTLNMMYEDNGKGFNLEQVKRGIGLENIKNRVTRLNGQLHIDSTPGYGMTAIIEIPIEHDKSTIS